MHSLKQHPSRGQHSLFLQLHLLFSLDSAESIFTLCFFNPPFSQNVKNNIGKTFLKLVKQYFPKHHKLNKIFNKNTLKLSYCCMKNMSSIIKQHNVKILSAESNEKRSCNCRNKECIYYIYIIYIYIHMCMCVCLNIVILRKTSCKKVCKRGQFHVKGAPTQDICQF